MRLIVRRRSGGSPLPPSVSRICGGFPCGAWPCWWQYLSRSSSSVPPGPGGRRPHLSPTGHRSTRPSPIPSVRPPSDGGRVTGASTTPPNRAGQVAASADGEVVFAGQVGGKQHVVVLHADGVRTSYSFLRSASVRRGDRVRQGQQVGTSDGSLHFGARIGEAYVDPTLLFGDGLPEVYLVPDGALAGRPGAEAQERVGLLRQLAAAVADAGKGAAGWVAGYGDGVLEEIRGAIHYGGETICSPTSSGSRSGEGLGENSGATARRAASPAPRLAERHIAILVGGLGSNSGDKAGIADIDTAALGFAADDVHRFSYRGGTVPTTRNAVTATALPSTEYGPADTTVDIRESARRLHDVLEATAAANPGVPIDVMAHSQGGLVARAALAYEHDPGGQSAAGGVARHPRQTPPGRRHRHRRRHARQELAGDIVEKGISTVDAVRPPGHVRAPDGRDLVVPPRARRPSVPQSAEGDVDRRPLGLHRPLRPHRAPGQPGGRRVAGRHRRPQQSPRVAPGPSGDRPGAGRHAADVPGLRRCHGRCRRLRRDQLGRGPPWARSCGSPGGGTARPSAWLAAGIASRVG